MESPFVTLISRLNVLTGSILIGVGVLLLYFVLTNRISALMFILVLSASLVGTTLPVIDGIASLARWLSLLLLLATGLLFSRTRISVELLLFWGYVLFGLVSMFWARSIDWQFQRGGLLVIVVAALSIAFGGRSYKTHRTTLVLIALVGAVFAFVNATSLPGQLTGATRFAGNSKTAPALTVVLGALVPFVFWATWHVKSAWLKAFLWLGFTAGMASLLLSGQRAGTIAGIVGLVPLVFTIMKNKKNAFWLVIIFGALVLLIAGNVSAEKLNYILHRYQLSSGLSNRDLIWQMALGEIERNPLFGQGIGAAEWVISSSFHNTYLEIWFNTGFLGLACFVAAQVCFFLRIRYLNRTVTNHEIRSVLALALGYMLGFVVLCLFESLGAGTSNLNMILYLYLGVLVSGDALFEGARLSLADGDLMSRSRPNLAGISVQPVTMLAE